MPRSRKRRERPYRQSMPLLPRRLPMPRAEIDHGLAWRVAYCYRGSVARVRDRIEEVGIATYLPDGSLRADLTKPPRSHRAPRHRPDICSSDWTPPAPTMSPSRRRWAARGASQPTAGCCAMRTAYPCMCRQWLWSVFQRRCTSRRGPGAPLRSEPLYGLATAIWQAFLGEVERSDDFRVRVLLDVFGRKTPVEFEASDLEAAA
jgi:hypothetical protein